LTRRFCHVNPTVRSGVLARVLARVRIGGERMPMTSPPASPPPPAGLRIEVVPRAALPAAHLDAVAALCERAYGEDLRAALAAFPDATHVLGWAGEPTTRTLVSHLCWVPRTLAYGGPPVRWPPDGLAPREPEAAGAVALPAAYVELVATEPACQGRGYATALLKAAAAAIAADPAYALGGLSPSDPAFYARLGWASWGGARHAAAPDGRVAPTPDEDVMVLRLPSTDRVIGSLDLERPLTAPWRPGEVW
jgi:GNAT superfamily N-acetyltransferase